MNLTLIGSSVHVVGTTDNQRGRQCDKHLVCGEALVVGSYVFFRRAQFAWRSSHRIVHRHHRTVVSSHRRRVTFVVPLYRCTRTIIVVVPCQQILLVIE